MGSELIHSNEQTPQRHIVGVKTVNTPEQIKKEFDNVIKKFLNEKKDKPAVGLIPKMESLKSNWGPGEYLGKEISKLGLKIRHESADSDRGLTGGFEIKEKINPEKIQKIIDSLNDKELVEGYTVKLTRRPYNDEFINYEFIKK